MRTSITNLNRTTQQLQQQISALQKELTELRALQTQKSGPSCPACNQPATYIPQYKQFYCYRCKDYIDL